jgi:hypothetical protein
MRRCFHSILFQKDVIPYEESVFCFLEIAFTLWMMMPLLLVATLGIELFN